MFQKLKAKLLIASIQKDNPEVDYQIDDSHYEIVTKNKLNILHLLGEIKNFPTDSEFQDLKTLVGNYDQDVADVLDETLSVIENLSIVASNLKSALNRISTQESKMSVVELTKADKTTTSALQADIDNIINLLEGVSVWDGTFSLDLTSVDNNVPITDPTITSALQSVQSGNNIVLKMSVDGTTQSVYLNESVDDTSFTSNKFFGNDDITMRVTPTSIEVNGVSQLNQNVYQLLEIRSQLGGATIDISGKANVDFSNVNLGTSNAKKYIRIKDDGHLEFVDAPEFLKVSGNVAKVVPFTTTLTTSGGNQFVIIEEVNGVRTESPIAKHSDVFLKSDYEEKQIWIPPFVVESLIDTGTIISHISSLKSSLEKGTNPWVTRSGSVYPIIEMSSGHIIISYNGSLRDITNDPASTWNIHYFTSYVSRFRITTLVKK